MKKFLFCLFVFFFLSFSFVKIVHADSYQGVHIYFFHSNTCGHCMEELDVLEKIKGQYKNVSIYEIEIHDEEGKIIYEGMRRLYPKVTNGVPVTIIGDKAYLGFDKNQSIPKFIKTIEYYSKYYYDDKLAYLVDKDYKEPFHVYKEVPSLDKFMKTYRHYSLMGFDTDSLDTSLSAFFIGILTSFNIIYVLSFICMIFVVNHFLGTKDKILFVMFYFLGSFLFRIGNVISYDYYTFILGILFLILFMYTILGYIKNKRRQFIMIDFLIILIILSECLGKYLNLSYYVMLHDIVSLHMLEGFDKIIYYANYFVSVFVIYVVFVLVIYLIFLKKLNK